MQTPFLIAGYMDLPTHNCGEGHRCALFGCIYGQSRAGAATVGPFKL